MEAHETERERMLHAMYDAWKMLVEQGEGGDVPAVILAGQLAAAEYPPYVKRTLRALGD